MMVRGEWGDLGLVVGRGHHIHPRYTLPAQENGVGGPARRALRNSALFCRKNQCSGSMGGGVKHVSGRLRRGGGAGTCLDGIQTLRARCSGNAGTQGSKRA